MDALLNGGRPAWFFSTPFPEGFKSPVGDLLEHKQSMANQAGTHPRHVEDTFDAFVHVVPQDRPPLITTDGESLPPTGDRIWVHPIDWGRHLVGYPMPGRVDTKGRYRYHQHEMAHPPPSATPSDTKEWERETWVAQMASLSTLRHHVPGDDPTPRRPAASPLHVHDRHVQSALHPLHHPVPRTNWPLGGARPQLPPPRRLRPPPHNPVPDTYTREDEPDNCHL